MKPLDLIDLDSLPVHELDDGNIALPKLRTEGLQGWIGELARHAADGTEVHPAAAALNALGYAAACLCSGAYLMIGDDRHRPILNLVHVGRTSLGGKGMSAGLVYRVHEALSRRHPTLAAPRCSGDLSSGEGLAFQMRDPEGDDPGVEDKRLWAASGEMAAMLSAFERNGNTLSSDIRNAWDGRTLGKLTKSNRITASHPSLCIVTAITPTELAAKVRRVDAENGTMNRFLFVWAERRGIEPFPTPTDAAVVEQLAEKLAMAVHITHRQHPVECSLSSEARELYAAFYAKWRRTAKLLPALVASLTERIPPYVQRIAMIFALLDYRTTINADDLRAGIAWADYAVDSLRYIINDRAGTEQAERTAQLGEQIMRLFGGDAVELTKTEITRAIRKAPASALDDALAELIRDGRIEMREVKCGGNNARQRTKLYSRNGVGNAGNAGIALLDKASSASHSAGSAGNRPDTAGESGGEILRIPAFPTTSQPLKPAPNKALPAIPAFPEPNLGNHRVGTDADWEFF